MEEGRYDLLPRSSIFEAVRGFCIRQAFTYRKGQHLGIPYLRTKRGISAVVGPVRRCELARTSIALHPARGSSRLVGNHRLEARVRRGAHVVVHKASASTGRVVRALARAFTFRAADRGACPPGGRVAARPVAGPRHGLERRRYRRTSGDGAPACDQRAEADKVDLDALLTAHRPVQGSFSLDFLGGDLEKESEISEKRTKRS